MKRKILVVMPGAMELGGVERSLIGLLSGFDYAENEVDLFLYGHHGPLFSAVPSEVNILPEIRELAYLRSSVAEKMKHGCFYSVLLRIRDAILSRRGPINFDATWAQVMRRCAHPIRKKYDLALCFFLPFDFMTEMVDAKVKIGWIHTDYSTETADPEFLCHQYGNVDLIAAVSEKCKQAFIKVCPDLEERIIVVENLLPEKIVRRDSLAFSAEKEMPEKGIRLLSVGRYCTAKNFDNVPDICARMIQAGLDVYWYIIGFGPDEQLIRQKIKEAGMEQRVILLGKKENPYPYIKACDLYVQPSRYEGKCVTVCEAQMLGKPVVISRYATSASQLENGVDGIIVPQDNAGCAEGIAALLADSEKMRQLSENCCMRDYSNSSEIDKFWAFCT